MGNRASRSKQEAPKQENVATKETLSTSTSPLRPNDGKIYLLKKRRPGCTGMFWRQDPTSDTMLSSGDHWPRDDAQLKGERVTDKWGDEWLRTTHVRNAGDAKWHRAPLGSAIPMEHEDHYYLEAQAE